MNENITPMDKDGKPISPLKTMQCSICRRVLYRNGDRIELPIICECGKSRIEVAAEISVTAKHEDPSKGPAKGKIITDLRYTNVMTEIDGVIYELH